MTATNLGAVIDALGKTKAAIADLEMQEKEFKEALSGLEPGAYEGELYRLTISVSDREARDKGFKEKIEELIETHLSSQYVTAHTTHTPVRTHRIAGRNGKGVTS